MKKNIYIVLFLLLLIKSTALFWGFDRLPFLPNNDEMVVNDCALSFSRGMGFRAASIPGPLKLDTYFGHYMPLYIFEQAAVFKLFGLSTFTLRIPNILFTVAYWVFFFLLLRRLLRLGIIDHFAFSLSAFLFLFEPTSLVWARQGRADSLALCLAMAAFLVVLSAKGPRPTRVRSLTGSFLIGLGLCAHLTVLPIALLYWVIVSLHTPKRSWINAFLFALTPLLVVLGFWVIAHGNQAIPAYHQLTRILEHLKVQGADNLLGIKFFSDIFFKRDLRGFSTAGGLLLFLAIAACIFIFVRFWLTRNNTNTLKPLWRNALYYAVFFAFSCVFIVAVIFSDSRTHRLIPLGPFTLIGLSIALSHLSAGQRRFKTAAIIFLAGFSVIGLTGYYVYFSKLMREWKERSPYRYAELIRSIPAHKKILSTHLLWFELSQTRRNAKFIIPDLPDQTLSSYMDNPGRVKPFDVVILTDIETPSVRLLEVFGPSYRLYTVKDIFSTYVVWNR